MNNPYSFKSIEINNIVSRFGKAFYNKVVNDIEKYALKWALTNFDLIQSYSANLVFRCSSKYYGDVVLKIGDPSSKEILLEYSVLQEYNGKPFCKVYDADISNRVFFEECVRPGIPLRSENCLNTRLSVFCEVYKGLHRPPVNAEVYPTYQGWVSRITDYMSSRQDCRAFYLHMAKAEELCATLSASYAGKMLLHGDLHHDNILMSGNGQYTIIDPKGVIGDPIFDVPRFILNEYDEVISPEFITKINDIVCIFEEQLHIPSDIIKRCLYVETVMATCWSIESGAMPKEFPKLMDRITFAESMMKVY